MKHLKKIFAGIAILTITGLMLTSCESDDLKLDTEANVQNLEIATTQTEIDNVSEEINDIGESIYLMYGNTIASKDSNTKYEIQGRELPECLTISKIITFDKINITLDYGDGCSNNNDNYLSGKIMLAIGFNIGEKSISIDYTFDNFYFNGKLVEGEMHKTKQKMNDNGNPVTTITKNIKITWEDGAFVTVQGERQREWVEGFGNKIWGDNVFSITGTWKTTRKNGIVRTAKITTPLIRKAACKFIVSGIVEINKNDKIITIDYGNGECDNLAMGYSNGKEYEIQLGKRKK